MPNSIDISPGSVINRQVEYAGFSETNQNAEFKAVVFRRIQEQLNNILHSVFSDVLPSLSQKEGDVNLIVSVNEKGLILQLAGDRTWFDFAEGEIQ